MRPAATPVGRAHDEDLAEQVGRERRARSASRSGGEGAGVSGPAPAGMLARRRAPARRRPDGTSRAASFRASSAIAVPTTEHLRRLRRLVDEVVGERRAALEDFITALLDRRRPPSRAWDRTSCAAEPAQALVDGEDHRHRVHLVLAGVLGRGAVDRLEHAVLVADVGADRHAHAALEHATRGR